MTYAAYFGAGILTGIAVMVVWACGPGWNEQRKMRRRAFG